ncbi:MULTISPECIES: TetR family transcriptional regulator [Roseobacteraceae]|uniref:TetR/AcrR family transcriptional regulator n=1 Tax=Roseobacteraceae TaxID=2854170 RepID=UPI00329A66AA
MLKTEPTGKALDILHAARMLMMDRGFNGFSFRDVAAEVGIKSASIHYHYATKADLAEATARAYRSAFKDVVAQIDAASAPDVLRAYGGVFVTTLSEQGRLCLGGVLAADVMSLPEQVRAEVTLFFEEQHQWVEHVVRNGQSNGELRWDLDAEIYAKMFVSSLEGAMMVSRGLQQPHTLEATLDMMVQLAQAAN